MYRWATLLLILISICSANAAPSAPTLSVERIGTTLTISWSVVLGADSYRLYYAPAPYMGPETVGFIDLGTSNSVSANLLEGLAFYVAVSAIGGGEEGSYSNVEEFSITLASDKGKSCEQLGEVFVDGDNDGVCDAIDPAPTIKRIDLLGYESTPAYGNEQFVSSRSNTLINASIVESYSVLKHSGYIYPDSAGGDPVIYPGTYYTNDMHYCRVGNFNGDEHEDLLVNSQSFFNTTNAKEPYDISLTQKVCLEHIFC
ncbi:MAG: fibronectin type III domain-containing protein [Gammaproteobacteria bacterium]|nr:fibronectin type III domain-containing protein [Gammaproteobacteria bacterium]